MRVLGRDKLTEFVRVHRDAEPWISAWLHEVEKEAWKQPYDLRRRYSTASLLGQGRVVFNVRGNRYRLIVQVRYQAPALVQVRWITANADGNDEWVGIDDITVIGDALAAAPAPVETAKGETNRTPVKPLRSPRDLSNP